MQDVVSGSVVGLGEARRRVATWRAAGQRVVFTNGHFDLLHLGHVDYLQRARALGDALVVGVNSDASTRALKGPQRPLVPDHERATILAALAGVDLVIVFDALTAEELVHQLMPEVYVKGGDWDPAGDTLLVRTDSRPVEPPEARIVRAYGGEVRYLPYLAGHSTSALIHTIVTRFAAAAANAEVT
jgi:rfaE bifunctional protein nucleotidyltransferase chain/domain